MEEIIENKKLHLIILGQDASLLDESSQAAQRTKVYSRFFSGINVYVFARKIIGNKKEYSNVSVFGFSTILQSLYAVFKIYKDIQNLKKEGVDVLVSTQDPFGIGFLGFIISKIHNLPFHVQVHTDISSKYMQNESIRSHMQILFAKFVLKKADRIRVVSRRVEEFCIQEYSILRKIIDYIPMVYKDIQVDTNFLENNPFSRRRVFLVPARFVSLKRIPYLIDAFAEVAKKDQSVLLQIVGKGPEEKNILHAIERNSLTGRVEIISWTDNIMSLYRNSYVTIVTSLYEGWCRVVTESVMNHTPVIMTDVGCAHEWLENGKQGIIVPIEDKNALTLAMSRVLENTSLHETLVRGCIEKAATIPLFDQYVKELVFSWQATISQSR